MTNQSGPSGSAGPFLYALFGSVFLAIGGMLLVDLDEDPEIFRVITVAFAAPGLYLLIAGAVARGIFVAGRWSIARTASRARNRERRTFRAAQMGR